MQQQASNRELDFSNYDDDIRTNRLIICPIATACCLFMFVLYYKHSGVRAPPCRLIVFRFICETVYSVSRLCSAIFEYQVYANIYLYALTKVALTGMIFWTFSSVTDVIFIGRNPFKADRYFIWFHLCSWTACVVYFVWMVIRYSSLGSPHRSEASVMTELTKEVDEQQAYMNICFVVGTLVVLFVTSIELSSGLKQTLISRQRVTRQLVVLVLGFAVSDSIRAALWLPSEPWKASHRHSLDLVYNVATIWDSLVWIFATQVCSRLLSRKEDPTSPKPKTSDALHHTSSYLKYNELEDKQDFGVDMRHELVLRTAVGISWCAQMTRERFASGADGVTVTDGQERYSALMAVASRRTSITQEEFTQHGFGSEEEFSNIKSMCVVTKPRHDHQDDCRISFDELASSPTWLSWMTETPEQAATPSTLQAGSRGLSSTGGVRPNIPLLPGDKNPLDFFNYEDGIFTAIRQKLGVTADAYYEAFKKITDFVHQDEVGNSKFENAKFKEIVSSGASGSYFYFTPCKQFIVKQISIGEKATLVKIAKTYFELCSHHPDTSIHYYGLYSIRLPLCSSRKIYFVVMKNFMYMQPQLSRCINLTFDLKGATTNRERFKSQHERDGVELRGEKGNSLLDWDWIKTKQTLDVTKPIKLRLFQGLRKDLRFLSQMQLIDYSILLGATKEHRDLWCKQEAVERDNTWTNVVDSSSTIETNPVCELQDHTISLDQRPKDPVQEEEEVCLTQPLRSVRTGELAYCFGMIDILEEWNCGWKAQGRMLWFVLVVLRCFGNPRGITSIRPKDYAIRFDEFVQDQILALEDDDVDVMVFDEWRSKDDASWRPWK